MGYRTIAAIEIVDYFLERSREYEKMAEYLQLMAMFEPVGAAGHLRKFGKLIGADCKADMQIMSMIKVELMSRRAPVHLGLVDDGNLFRRGALEG